MIGVLGMKNDVIMVMMRAMRKRLCVVIVFPLFVSLYVMFFFLLFFLSCCALCLLDLELCLVWVVVVLVGDFLCVGVGE